jgi:hypothetical protein
MRASRTAAPIVQQHCGVWRSFRTPTSAHERVPNLRQLRTATAIVVLIDRGYADDAGPLVRALAAGTISFAALTQTDSDDRGYLFAQHGRDRHLKWSDSVRERNKVLTEKEKNLPLSSGPSASVRKKCWQLARF